MKNENQNTEYKRKWKDEYLKWVCGFANAQGGKIYIGIEDDHSVVGIDKPQEVLEEIPNKIVSTLGIVAEVNLVSMEGKDVLEIIVEPSNIPISYKGSYYYRSGSTKQELKGLALHQFLLKKTGLNWEEMTDKIIRVLSDKYLVRPIHYEGLQRIEPLEIPEEALREIIFNSIVHRDYQGSWNQMSVYNDHIRLWNDGTLPDDYTVDTLLGKHTSKLRNPKIANVFYKAGFIEAWGRGIQKIMEGFQDEGLTPPTFVVEQGGVSVMIPRERFVQIGLGENSHTEPKTEQKTDLKGKQKNTDDKQDKNDFKFKGEPKTEPKTEPKILILAIIKDNPTISRIELGKILGLHMSSVQRRLNALVKEGKLRHIGPTNGGHWEVIE